MHYTVWQWLLFFYIYCFFGWCIETTFVSCRKRQFVNRGFLTGPVIPIYGSGAVAILWATLPVRESWIGVFLLGMAAATLLEYVTGAVIPITGGAHCGYGAVLSSYNEKENYNG